MARSESVRVAVVNLTTRQMLRYLVTNVTAIAGTVNRMEAVVADLTAAVTELKGAIDGVAARLLPKVAALEAALAAAQADDETASDVLAEAAQATADIRTEVDRLNALGTDPTTPVDTGAGDVEPPEVIVPADPEAPVETTPGDEAADPEAAE